MFEWESADLMPANAMGTVNVSFDPVSAVLGDTFDDMRGAAVPRFIASDNTQDVLDISLCTTTLLFPFVTNSGEYDTGLAISNMSEESGSCEITYSGSNAPEEPLTSSTVAAGGQWSAVASMISPGFQGFLTVACGFREAYGFAFITDGFDGEPTRAQGYLAVCKSCD